MDTFQGSKENVKEMNKALLDVLKIYIAMDDKFTGKLILNFNCGGISSIEKTQVFR